MKQNVGTIDRIIRMIAAIVIVALYFTNQITGTAAIILGVIALVAVVTSIIGICPAYLAVGVSTKEEDKEE